MSSRQPSNDVEQWVARQLQLLPQRRAPATLSTKVLMELQRRAAQPWWHKSFLHWPLSARMAFIALCLGLSNASIALLRWLSAAPRGVELSVMLNRPFGWVEHLIAIAQGAQDFVDVLLWHLPASWFYGGVLTLVLLYMALFGIGATAYRTLYANR
jgi:hypothetical protein